MNIKKYQMGGEMQPPAQEQQPQGGDPMEMIASMMMEAVETQDGQAALTACEAFLGYLQESMGGGEAPAPEEQPQFRLGGKIFK